MFVAIDVDKGFDIEENNAILETIAAFGEKILISLKITILSWTFI